MINTNLYERQLRRIFKRIMKEIDKKTQHCLFPNCNKSPINSHAFQQNGVINLLHEKNFVYTTNLNRVKEFNKYDKKSITSDYLYKTTLKNATTFPGFCREHDDLVFSPIEKKGNASIEELIFLNAYRGLAYIYYFEKKNKLFLNEVKYFIDKLDNRNLRNIFFDFFNKHIATTNNDYLQFEDFFKKTNTIFNNDKFDLKRFNNLYDFKCYYIPVKQFTFFSLVASNTIAGIRSAGIVCNGVLPFGDNHVVFYILRLKRLKRLKNEYKLNKLIKQLDLYRDKNNYLMLKNFIQNVTILSSSNIVARISYINNMTKNHEYENLYNLHINSMKGNFYFNPFQNYGFNLFD